MSCDRLPSPSLLHSPWLERDHPDPHGEQLRQIASVLKVFVERARRFEGCRVGVFWDYCALPQKSRAGDADDRTEEEKARFKRALNGINAWYGHPKTYVLLVKTPLPTGHVYTNTQPYEGRGWCVAESLMSGMVKDSQALLDASKLLLDLRDPLCLPVVFNWIGPDSTPECSGLLWVWCIRY